MDKHMSVLDVNKGVVCVVVVWGGADFGHEWSSVRGRVGS